MQVKREEKATARSSTVSPVSPIAPRGGSKASHQRQTYAKVRQQIRRTQGNPHRGGEDCVGQVDCLALSAYDDFVPDGSVIVFRADEQAAEYRQDYADAYGAGK